MVVVAGLQFKLRTLSVIRRIDLESKFPSECIILEVLLPMSKGILFETFYLPPSQILDPFKDVLESSGAESKELLVTGDFNRDYLAKPCSRVTNELKGTLICHSSSIRLKEQLRTPLLC